MGAKRLNLALQALLRRSPGIVRVKSGHGPGDFRGLGSEVFLVNLALLIDDEGHHPRVAPFRRPGNQGKSGNISHRVPEGFLVTPTGMDYDALEPADIVPMRFDGTHGGTRLPSSEWRFHRDILAARPEFNAVVHTHSMFATTLACLGREVPAFHYMVAAGGGDSIRCAPYATFGSQELADNVIEALRGGRNAAMMQNHGSIAYGSTMDQAIHRLELLEWLAELYWRASSMGTPHVLTDKDFEAIIMAAIEHGYGALKKVDKG
jgi:L-fuculose-phosphate aldolase